MKMDNRLYAKITWPRQLFDGTRIAENIALTVCIFRNDFSIGEFSFYMPGALRSKRSIISDISTEHILPLIGNAGVRADYAGELVSEAGVLMLIEPVQEKVFSINLIAGSRSASISDGLSIKASGNCIESDHFIKLIKSLCDIWQSDDAKVYTLGDASVDEEGFMQEPRESILWKSE